MQTIQNDSETIGGIAAKDIRKAEVFSKHDIDFCCGGKRSLVEVCVEKQIDVEKLKIELYNSTVEGTPVNDFFNWSPSFLADYIYNQHHTYFYRENPLIIDLFKKVTDHHGNKYAFLQLAYDIYLVLSDELKTHFTKEETVVFPFIKKLSESKKGDDKNSELITLTEPIKLMEADHEMAGDLLAKIRSITDNYKLPSDACNSFTLLYFKMNKLEKDLKTHIHLENNILFPAALKLQGELKTLTVPVL